MESYSAVKNWKGKQRYTYTTNLSAHTHTDSVQFMLLSTSKNRHNAAIYYRKVSICIRVGQHTCVMRKIGWRYLYISSKNTRRFVTSLRWRRPDFLFCCFSKAVTSSSSARRSSSSRYIGSIHRWYQQHPYHHRITPQTHQQHKATKKRKQELLNTLSTDILMANRKLSYMC